MRCRLPAADRVQLQLPAVQLASPRAWASWRLDRPLLSRARKDRAEARLITARALDLPGEALPGA